MEIILVQGVRKVIVMRFFASILLGALNQHRGRST